MGYDTRVRTEVGDYTRSTTVDPAARVNVHYDPGAIPERFENRYGVFLPHDCDEWDIVWSDDIDEVERQVRLLIASLTEAVAWLRAQDQAG